MNNHHIHRSSRRRPGSIILLFVMLTFVMRTMVNAVLAAPATPSATPKMSTASATTKKIEDLKDRLATKVAELHQTSRRAIFGTVKSTSITSFVVETKTKDIKIELMDEIKVIQYLKGKRTSLTTEDISKGDVVTVIGDHDATLDLLKANVVFIQSPNNPMRLSGIVTARDDQEFTLTIATSQNQTYIIDIEKATKTLAWDRSNKEIIKSGFSKIAVGSTVHVMGFPVPKMDLKLSAERIVDLGNFSGSAQQAVPPSPTPSEKQASPSASPTKKLN
ncbi:hypothetical protein HY949_01065 [Candidatus Gottesmanbacteria bacterium]|nr:hypothetical protein [Candidatus Gottesmanbacteria bacterium]